MIRNLELGFLISSFFLLWIGTAAAKCSRGCETALASYYVSENNNLTYISELFGVDINTILSYNRNITNRDSIVSGSRVNVSFSCDCLNGDFLGHIFRYQARQGDTYEKIATEAYKNLSTIQSLRMFNSVPELNIPLNSLVNVSVNCSCGDRSISKDYGFFLTYPLRPEDNLTSIVTTLNTPPADVVQRYNDGLNFSSGAGLAFIPVRGDFLFFSVLRLDPIQTFLG